MRTDGGGEFKGAVQAWLEELGVNIHRTAPYTPQQNGRMERVHRDMAGGIRTALLTSGLPPPYWAEALRHWLWVRNRVPHKALPQITPTPVHAWTGQPADLSMARPFGCMGVITVPPDTLKRMGKLGDRGVVAVHLGVDSQAKAWRMYDQVTNRVKISRWVEFMEGLYWGVWQSSSKGGSSPVLQISTPDAVLSLLPTTNPPAERQDGKGA